MSIAIYDETLTPAADVRVGDKVMVSPVGMGWHGWTVAHKEYTDRGNIMIDYTNGQMVIYRPNETVTVIYV